MTSHTYIHIYIHIYIHTHTHNDHQLESWGIVATVDMNARAATVRSHYEKHINATC